MLQLQEVYALEPIPERYDTAIFLGGPTPAAGGEASWRSHALRLLEDAGYRGVVFLPEVRVPGRLEDAEDLTEWLMHVRRMSDCLVFWFPENPIGARDLIDLGQWAESGRVVLGTADRADAAGLQRYAAHHDIPFARTLEETILNALAFIGAAARREGGERDVPLLIWRTPAFQRWYMALRAAGNELRSTRPVATFRIGPGHRLVVSWVIHASIYVTREGRIKTEVVTGWPDVSTVMLYRRAPDLLQTQIVLVREYRPCSRTEDGYVRELPGGSSFDLDDPLAVGVAECAEETGFTIDPVRLRHYGTRQFSATTTSHVASLFAAEISDEELRWFRAQRGVPHGVPEVGEVTFVEVVILAELLSAATVDWGVLGMILTVLSRATGSRS
jgi:8-oxo-dGTP pyrophosphatase MutT (NUDIX family)